MISASSTPSIRSEAAEKETSLFPQTQGPIRWQRVLFRGHRELHEVELLALLLRTSGRQQGSVWEQARRCWEGFQDLRALERAGVQEIANHAAISSDKAAAIKAALELGRRLAQQPLSRGEAFVCSRQIWRAYGPRMAGQEQETFWALLLDQGNRLLREVQVSAGSINRCPVTPTEVFAPALREKAVGMILLHNHPSGHPEPSPEDRALTERLQQVAQLVGIRLLDHLVLGDQSYVSFADRGWL
jgi:DNA repair protein RadC